MRSSLASRSHSGALAAAMSRHPAAGARAAAPAPVRPTFAAVASLLTGPWRVNDPVAFAAAMRSAPLVAGHPVVDLAACARRPTVDYDPFSLSAARHLETVVAGAAGRAALDVRWAAGVGGRYLFVEAAGRAPADGEGPELLVLAHLVEPAGPTVPVSGGPPFEDDSWMVIVVGDGRGGVAGIGRATVPGPPAPSSRRFGRSVPAAPPPPARLGLAGLRQRLAGPARAAEGLDAAGGEPPEGVVLPFRH